MRRTSHTGKSAEGFSRIVFIASVSCTLHGLGQRSGTTQSSYVSQIMYRRLCIKDGRGNDPGRRQNGRGILVAASPVVPSLKIGRYPTEMITPPTQISAPPIRMGSVGIWPNFTRAT